MMNSSLSNLRAARIVALFVLSLAFSARTGTALAADVTDANAFEKSATAATPAEHEALATYFRSKADDAGKEAALHEKMLTASQSAAGGKNYAAMLPHCQSLIRANRAAQKSYEDLATLHAGLAKESGK